MAEFRDPNDALTILGHATVHRPGNAKSKATYKRIYERTCQLMRATGVYALSTRERASLDLQVFELRVIEIFHQQHMLNGVPRE